MDTSRHIADYYNLGLERGRLDGGQGKLEFVRTARLLERFLPVPPASIIDVGGGPGRYAFLLAERGYDVRLIDPMALHVDQVREKHAPRVAATVGDARNLDLPDECADAILML